MRTPPDSRKVRPAAVAGRFYPADPAALRRTIEEMLASAESVVQEPPLALIAPHAGYIFSGPIAASAYIHWKPEASAIRRVAIIGPSHFVEVDGLAASPASGFETPMGVVPVDMEAVDMLVERGLAGLSETAHRREHSIEVELPFLQVVLDRFSIVPLLVGDASAGQVANAIQALWDNQTRVVISSDLSHYLDWAGARRIDQLTAHAIARLQYEAIGHDQACGRIPICGLLRAAEMRGLGARVLDLRNSGDTAGPRDQVVGYGAFAIGPKPPRNEPGEIRR